MVWMTLIKAASFDRFYSQAISFLYKLKGLRFSDSSNDK